jgi:hypothetical protein
VLAFGCFVVSLISRAGRGAGDTFCCAIAIPLESIVLLTTIIEDQDCRPGVEDTDIALHFGQRHIVVLSKNAFSYVTCRCFYPILSTELSQGRSPKHVADDVPVWIAYRAQPAMR